MSFFDVPATEEPEEPARPPWFGPPDDEVGVVIVIERAVARTQQALVSVRSTTVYREGFSVAVAAYRAVASEDDDELDLWDDMAFMRGRGADADEVLRFGVEFANGSKATNLDRFPQVKRGELPSSPVLTGGPQGGGGSRTDLSYWVWPLPPPGPLAFVCEWPSEAIPVSRIVIEGDVVRDAAVQARRIWD
jgi:hypothetical protein